MKKVFALLLALVMIVSLVPISSAAEIELPKPFARFSFTENYVDSIDNYTASPVGNVTIDKVNGLTLPGGTDSSTNYVQLPIGIFKDSENLTISTWLKINTSSGNYSALWFGTPAVGVLPTNYWLFNPTNPSGLCKSVFTNSNNSSSPWASEVGINSGNTTQYFGKWAHFTTVITPTSISAYINGSQVGSTVTKSKLISEFNGELSAYIGRSNYLEDWTYAGSFRNLTVYKEAMTAEQVAYAYNTVEKDVLDDISLQQAAQTLTLGDTSSLYGDIELPTTLDGGITVEWASSDEDVISNEGKVTVSDTEKSVTLTATLKYNNVSCTKEFTATVIAADKVIDAIGDGLRLSRFISADTVLPDTIGDASIIWESDSEAVSADGTITAPETGMSQPIALAANISYNGKTAKKSFEVVIMGKDSSYVMGYTRTPDSNDQVYSIRLGNSMHLAYSEDGKDYTALNNNFGVLFAKSDTTVSYWGTTFLLTQPYIFRTKDGSFGVIAVRTGDGGNPNANGSLLFFKSDDLLSYEEIGLINVDPSGKAISDATCEFDASLGKYVIAWNNSDGSYATTTEDFESFSDVAAGEGFKAATTATSITGAIEGNIIAVTAEEAKKLNDKLVAIHNTSVSEVKLETSVGSAVSLENEGITAYYSDGSSQEMSVTWNQEQYDAIDFNVPGTYEVKGTVDQVEFDFPALSRRADPNVQYFNGKYYFISTWDNGQNRLYIRESDTLAGLLTAPDELILSATSRGDMSGCLWAPELHIINGKLYIFFAAGTNGQWNSVQARVWGLEGDDPTNADDWGEIKRVVNKDGEYLYDTNTQGITLDMTYFEQGDKSYVCWSQRQIRPNDAGAHLWIAELDRNEPWKLLNDPVPICLSDYGWDRNTSVVVEGANVLHRNGKFYMTFSGSNVDATYLVGLLTADENADLMDPKSWVKTNYPILTSFSIPGEWGPGHNSYFIDGNGDTYNIYHAKASINGTRDLGIRKVYWSADGTPVLDMTADREIAPQFKTVTATITVTGEPVEVEPLSSDKDMYLVNEEITLTATTATDVVRLGIFNEAGKGISQLSSEYVDNGATRTWTVTVKMGTKGNRTLSAKALKDGEAFSDVEAFGTTDFIVVKEIQPETEPVKPEIISVEAPEIAQAKQYFTFTVKTTQAVANVGLFNESNAGISTSKSYVDEGNTRIWTVKANVSSRGNRALTVKIAEVSNNWLDISESFNITLTK